MNTAEAVLYRGPSLSWKDWACGTPEEICTTLGAEVLWTAMRAPSTTLLPTAGEQRRWRLCRPVPGHRLHDLVLALPPPTGSCRCACTPGGYAGLLRGRFDLAGGLHFP